MKRFPPPPSPHRAADFRRRLLGWYRTHGRHNLPWRGAFTLYRVLVSEFMLQQTTVTTVIPYFRRFLKSFPTLDRLAKAPLESVLRQWSGLGYYARARNLHRTARILIRANGKKVRLTRESAESLPGVGPYTAGALLSFAHDLPEALVDGNVIRVLSRIFGVDGDTRQPDVREKIWSIARILVPDKGSRHFNSALMDFGATVCKPGLPDCPHCPLASLCWARGNGWVDRLPEARPDKAKTIVHLTAFRVEEEGKVLLRRRPLGGLWGGLWELPMTEEAVKPSATVSVSGGKIEGIQRLGTFRHILSHRDLRVTLWEARLVQPILWGRWIKKEAAPGMANSTLTNKLLNA